MTLNITIPEGTQTKYEKARIIGTRATQIAAGAPILVKLSEKELEELKFSPMAIAKLEYSKGLIPIDIKRILPHEWKY